MNIKLENEDFKNVCTSWKSCKFTEGCVLESKFGQVSINLEAWPDIQKITIHCKRHSGDGKVRIINGNEVQDLTVFSKISQILEIEKKSNIIEIQRPSFSSGDISILGLTLHPKDLFDGETLALRWKSLIARCGKYQSLRMVGERLFAVQGSFIENGSAVSLIETNPPGFALRENGKIVFTGSCEITNLKVDENVPVLSNPAHDLFSSRPAPLPILPDTPVAKPDITSHIFTKYLKPNINVMDANKISTTIYDGKGNLLKNTIPSSSKLVKHHLSNGSDYIVIKRGGTYSLPIAALSEDKEYVVVITGKKLNGNGKAKVSFGAGNTLFNPVPVLFGPNNEDIFVTVPVGKNNNYPGESLKLHFFMDDESMGEIIFSRIRVVEGSCEKMKSPWGENVHSFVPQAKYKKRFVIVIPSYNNVEWCDKNIYSTINQDYENYRIIFTDDCSKDGTFEKVSEIVNSSSKSNKFTLIKNSERKGALANLYDMIHSCEDEEIVLTLDGDDWLANENVLNILNDAYNEDVWMTYGQYQNWPDGGTGIAQQIPENVISNNSFRHYTWCSSHLRTFYAWLFKCIKLEDFKYNQEFMSMAWDMTIMFPMLEMAGPRSKFLSEFLYIYNLSNPINDHKVNRNLQQTLDRYVRAMPKYPRLSTPKIAKKTIGLLIIATAKYKKFLQGLISSADNYFLKNHNVRYFVFSDEQPNVQSKREVVYLPIEHRPFPYASMQRFDHFTQYADRFENENYLFYVDVDSLFVDHVGDEILSDLTGVSHCGYFGIRGPVEDNPNSCFYANPSRYKTYFGGGFSGGKKNKYLELSRVCSEQIKSDLEKGIIPKFHDETAINKYFLDNPPSVTLTPSYHYPQSNLPHYQKIWGNHQFSPKILLLDKNHAEIRS